MGMSVKQSQTNLTEERADIMVKAMLSWRGARDQRKKIIYFLAIPLRSESLSDNNVKEVINMSVLEKRIRRVEKFQPAKDISQIEFPRTALTSKSLLDSKLVVELGHELNQLVDHLG
jgi:hypothetical protein